MLPIRRALLFGLFLAGHAMAAGAGGTLPASNRVEVFYFHRTTRCHGCLDMEAFTAAAADRFPAERLSGRLTFRAVNLDDATDRHFAQDYALDFSSVVLSRRVAGQEAAWTNLSKAWELVGDQTNFTAYVEMEIAAQLKQLSGE